MSNTKTEAGHKSAADAATRADKPQKPSRARKSAAHSRPNAKAARPDHAKSARAKGKRVSRADLVQLDVDRWLVVADENDLARTAKLAMAALASTGRIFLMAGSPVELTYDDRHIAPELRVLDYDGLASVFCEVVGCVGYDHDTGNLKPGPGPAQLAKLIQVHRPYSELPVLKAIVVGPAKRPDGTMITESGYDERSGMLVVDVSANRTHFAPAVFTGDAELDALLAELG